MHSRIPQLKTRFLLKGLNMISNDCTRHLSHFRNRTTHFNRWEIHQETLIRLELIKTSLEMDIKDLFNHSTENNSTSNTADQSALTLQNF